MQHTRALLMAVLIAPMCLAADPPAARFALHGARIELAEHDEAVEPRFTVAAQARWMALPSDAEPSRFALKTLGGGSCTAGGDAVFGNGFE